MEMLSAAGSRVHDVERQRRDAALTRGRIAELSAGTIDKRVLDSAPVKTIDTDLYRGERPRMIGKLPYSKFGYMSGIFLTDVRDYALMYALSGLYGNSGVGVHLMGDEWNSRQPVLYTCQVRGLRFLDLSEDREQERVLKALSLGFYRFLHRALARGELGLFGSLDREWPDAEREIINDSSLFREFIEAMGGKDVINATFRKLEGVLSEYVRSLGFDGVITTDAQPSNHAILVFDPASVRIKSTKLLRKPSIPKLTKEEQESLQRVLERKDSMRTQH